ncbi:MAG: tetratricopeptide repeat protein [Acidobacteriota bacterium]
MDYYDKALLIFRAIGERSKEADTLNDIGLINFVLGEKQKALDYYDKALLISRAIGDSYLEADALKSIGSVYYSLGEKQKALDCFNKALLIRRAIGDRHGEVHTLDFIGLVYSSLGEKQKALDYYNQELQLARAIGSKSLKTTELHIIYNLARVEHAQGNLVEALAKMEEAIKLLEYMGTKRIGWESRANHFQYMQRWYEFYIDLLMQLHQKNPSAGYNILALEATERARARSLLDLLAESRVGIHQGIDVQLLEREKPTTNAYQQS